MKRGIVSVVAAVGLLSAAAPPGAAAPDHQVTLVAYRTTRGAASLDLHVDVPPGDRPSFLAMVVATVDRGRIESVDLPGVTLFGDASQTQVRADGRRTVLCDHGVCALDSRTMSAGGAARIVNEAGDDRFNVLFVVARASRVTWEARADGWTVKRVPMRWRLVAGRDAAEVGAWSNGSGVERFREASAPGGAAGSIGISEPPCSEAVSGVVSRGAGTLTLDGGVERETFTCPTDRGALASWHTRRTTWRVHGDVTGETTLAGARLFVLDLPRALPVPRTWPWR